MTSPSQSVIRRAVALPAYLRQTYRWAYLDRRLLPWLDQPWVVSAILWGNARRLMTEAIDEFQPGQNVLQAAAVYGNFSTRFAARLGSSGALEVCDVAPLQVANVRRKCQGLRQVRARVHDLAEPLSRSYDGVCCFFLLHEVPAEVRPAIVRNLLAAVTAGGKVVFVDYHRPAPWHPLAPLMRWIFRHFEPYAPSLLDSEIAAIAGDCGNWAWSSRRAFGGLYQIVVAVRS